jgi:predicted phage replisome organizer/uncharacterized phage protein (TIGR02220 family)
MFFFLKPENYYRQDFVRKIRSLKNGFEYLTLYEEILTDTLNKEGVLANFYGDEIVPYTIDELSTIFQHKPSIIKNGLELFEKYKMIEKNDDGAYFIPNALEFTKRTTVGSVKKKEQRNNKKLKEQDESEVDICPSVNEEECLTNIDKEININIDLNNNKREIVEIEEKKDNSKELSLSATSNILKDVLNLFNEYEGYERYHANNEQDTVEILDKINKGYGFESFQKIFKKKLSEWGCSEKMKSFIRPKTLYGSRFEQYLEESEIKEVDELEDIVNHIYSE